MTIGTDEQVPNPIPDVSGHVEGRLSFLCNDNKGLVLEFPAITVGAAKQTFSVILVNALYGGKRLSQACGKDDGSGLNDGADVHNEFKDALMIVHFINPSMLDGHGRIRTYLLIRQGSAFICCHAAS